MKSKHPISPLVRVHRCIFACDLLRDAIKQLRIVGCTKAAQAVARALKSADGARRHADCLRTRSTK